MKTRALLVLATIFTAAFFGRIVVFASDLNDSLTAPPDVKSSSSEFTCIDGVLAENVKERIATLDARETDIANRMTEMKAYEKLIETRLAELEKANQKLKGNLEERQVARQADIAKLAAIYEGMKPAQAATIIDEMDPEFAAGLLASMNSEQAAQIVAAIDSQRAYLISVMLANRAQTP